MPSRRIGGYNAAYSVCFSNLPPYDSAKAGTDRFMSAGTLSGRSKEEMSGSQGDLLQELSQMHE